MCIIILNSHNKLNREILETSAENNPDGFGMMWSENNKLRMYKTFDIEMLIRSYEYVRSKSKTPIVLHFRIATSGKINIDNTHPFWVNNELAFCHNGVISGLGNKEVSDTIEFNNLILKKLPKGFLQNEAIITLIEEYISTNKLVFLNNRGEYFIINRIYWETDKDNNWFSNGSYKPRVYTSAFGNSYSAYNKSDEYWNRWIEWSKTGRSNCCLICDNELKEGEKAHPDGICKECENTYYKSSK